MSSAGSAAAGRPARPPHPGQAGHRARTILDHRRRNVIKAPRRAGAPTPQETAPPAGQRPIQLRSRNAGNLGLPGRPSRITGMMGRLRLANSFSASSTSRSCHGPVPFGPTNTATDPTDFRFSCSSSGHRWPGSDFAGSEPGQDAAFPETRGDRSDLLEVPRIMAHKHVVSAGLDLAPDFLGAAATVTAGTDTLVDLSLVLMERQAQLCLMSVLLETALKPGLPYGEEGKAYFLCGPELRRANPATARGRRIGCHRARSGNGVISTHWPELYTRDVRQLTSQRSSSVCRKRRS